MSNKRKSNQVGQDDSSHEISSTLYVKNLNDKVDVAVLKHHLYLYFSCFGDLIDIVIKSRSSKMRGQAHIIFANSNQSTIALKSLQDCEFFDKKMKISYSHKKSKVIEETESLVEL